MSAAAVVVAAPLGFVGRFLGLGGTVLMLGLAVFAATVLTAADPERNRLIRSLGLIGLIVVFGAVFELTAVIAGTDSWSALGRASAWTSMLDSSQGPAIGLRLVGGAVAAVALGWSAVRVPAVAEARQLELGGGAELGSGGGPVTHRA